MHGEVPQFKRCCFCLPLRRGLIAWGYAKMALNLLTIAYVVAIIVEFIRRTRMDIGLIIMTICLLIGSSFDIIFIVASHKKSVKLLKVSYVYNIVWLSLVLLGNCFQAYEILRHVYNMWDYPEYRLYITLNFIFSAGLAFSLIFVQIYLILLIRSEMAKLREQTLEMQFSNHLATGEPQCTLHNHNASDADQCEGKTQVAQACCTGEAQVQHCCTNEKSNAPRACKASDKLLHV